LSEKGRDVGRQVRRREKVLGEYELFGKIMERLKESKKLKENLLIEATKITTSIN